jgi:hypothetical protein
LSGWLSLPSTIAACSRSDAGPIRAFDCGNATIGIYHLRSTFASDALAAGVSVFELARIMGTSVRMIERHYGTLLDGAGAGIAGRLDALDRERDGASEEADGRV